METEMKTKRILLLLIPAVVMCLTFTSCDSGSDNAEMSTVTTTVATTSYPDEQPVGYYKRFSVVKEGETFEEMLELRDIENKGYLVLNDDWTAYFELEGVRTEYTYDKKNFYLKEDTEKSSGFSYVYIGGRLVVDEGTTIIQYMKLTDDELAYYLEHGSETDADDEK